MAINKIDIYGDNWLELVFENRNKSYGAYDLRKHYTATVLKALGIAFLSIAGLIYGLSLLFKPAPLAIQPIRKEVNAVLKQYAVVNTAAVSPPLILHHHRHTASGHTYATAPAIAQQPAVSVVITPANTQIQSAVPTAPAENDNQVFASADVKPLPTGGAQGWMSYLQKNLIYPEAARHAGISGKVWLSFVVEKDGSLSNIHIDQSAGNGFDEEAVRVLKQSPVWQPGLKNGQPIRIQYRLPVNFKMVK